jgi:hypothetical protein
LFHENFAAVIALYYIRRMHEVDITLKLLLTESLNAILRRMGSDAVVARWLNVELPVVRNQRVDLLVELSNGEILHIELQSTNDPDMPWRMLEYAVAIYRRLGKFPRQLVLYVGNGRMRMGSSIREAGMDFRYDLLDIRDVDGETLLQSDHIADNLLAILTGTTDYLSTIRRIIGKIARLEHGRREDALRKLLILSGMRGLAKTVEREKNNIPVTFDIMDNEVLGPMIRKGLEQGLEQGRGEGRKVITALLEQRFGKLPAWVGERLSRSPLGDTDLALRMVNAKSLEELQSLLSE